MREAGYYWVKYRGKMEIAQYLTRGNMWGMVFTQDHVFFDNDFEWISDVKLDHAQIADCESTDNLDKLDYPR